MSKLTVPGPGKIFSIVLFIMPLLSIAANTTTQEQALLIWVNDIGVRDSQFGYFDGKIAYSTEPIFVEHDFEGLACVRNTIYAVSAMDGLQPSRLFTVQLDRTTNRATVALVGVLQTTAQEPFFEVAALSEKGDGTLWGFATVGEQRGILRIDPVTATAELVLPASLDVEGMEWAGDTLWLVSRNRFYTWISGGAITFAFQLAVEQPIEALDIVDGLLWIGIHNDQRGVIVIDPTTGAIVPNQGFSGADDIESLTFCPLPPAVTPTATERPVIVQTAVATIEPTATMTVTPTATLPPTPTATPTLTPSPTLRVLPTMITADPPTPQPPTAEEWVDEPAALDARSFYLPLVTR